MFFSTHKHFQSSLHGKDDTEAASEAKYTDEIMANVYMRKLQWQKKITIIHQKLQSVKHYKYITVFSHSVSNHQERDSVPKNENGHQLLTLMLF